MNTIGERIKFLRTKHKLSMEDFATAIGTNKSGISSYENNKYEPSAKYLIQISKQFNVSIDWILTGEGREPGELNQSCIENQTKKDIEGFEETLNFLSDIIKEGKLSREDLLQMLFELQYDMRDSDDDAIYQEFVSQYELNMLQNYRLLSERDQGKVDGIIESMVSKVDKKPDYKKGVQSSQSKTSRDETSSGSDSDSRVTA